MKRQILLGCMIIFLMGCKTVNFNKTTIDDTAKIKNKNANSLKEEEQLNAKQIEQFEIEKELKEVDIEKTIVYIEKPIYYPVEKAPVAEKGKTAVTNSLQAAIQEPQNYSGGVMYYDFKESFVYEIYCQPYRITDLALEPGEQVLENPFLSENQVWQIGAGVSRKNNQDVQHFYLKPDMSGLITSMIIITDRRVYHLLLKSFKDYYMAMVEFQYPNTMPYTIKTDLKNALKQASLDELNKVDPRFLSFDYKMTYSFFKKPVWLPKRVYDDGRKTYIQLDETVLHTASPVLFNKTNERVNYRVDKNLIIIDELIEKITLQLSKEKVTITKKNYKPSKEEKSSKVEVEEEIINTSKKELQKYHIGNTEILESNQFGNDKIKEAK